MGARLHYYREQRRPSLEHGPLEGFPASAMIFLASSRLVEVPLAVEAIAYVLVEVLGHLLTRLKHTADELEYHLA